MSQSVVRSITLSLDTNAYGSGDVIAATQELTEAVKALDGGAFLESMTVIDKDDQGAAFDVYVMDANVAMGTENSTPNISDANAENILGKIAVGTSDYSDLGGVKVATIKNLHIPIKSSGGTSSVYVAVVNGSGTPTYTAAGIVLRFGIVYG